MSAALSISFYGVLSFCVLYSASIRRSSMRGDKTQLFKKEHKEEALHFGLNLMQDEDLLMEAEEEHEHVPATDLDEVTIVVSNEDDHSHPASQPPPLSTDTTNTPPNTTTPPKTASVTTIAVNKPTPKPRSHATVPSSPEMHTQPAGSQSRSEAQVSNKQLAGDGPKREMTVVQPPPVRAPSVPQASPNVSLPQESNHAGPPQPQAPGNQTRRQSGSTLIDLKKHRSNSRENLADIAMQSMFLESLQGGRRVNTSGSSPQGNSVAGGDRSDKTKNGHNNNNTTVQGYASSPNDGQLRRFVAPTHSRVVGEEEDKERCCVIL